MKVFIIFLVLIFSFQSWTKAEDIRDFQIEGMSIGDSLLDYFSKAEIENNKVFEVEQKNNKEVSRYYILKNAGSYDFITASFNTSDKQYKIIELSGFVNSSFKDCKEKRKNIDKELKLLFENLVRQETGDTKHQLDKSTKVNHIAYWFGNDAYIALTCYDWSKKSGYEDQLRLEIYSSKYLKWLRSLGT